jgi:hypothetical protein
VLEESSRKLIAQNRLFWKLACLHHRNIQNARPCLGERALLYEPELQQYFVEPLLRQPRRAPRALNCARGNRSHPNELRHHIVGDAAGPIS